MVSRVCGGNQMRSTKKSVKVCLTVKHDAGSLMICGCMSAAGTGELQFIEGTINANMYCDILKLSMIPSLRRLGHRGVFQHDNDNCLAKEAEGKGDGLAKHVSRPTPYWASVGHPQMECGGAQTSTSSVMSSWRSGRGLQWQPLKLWWTPCPRGLRQCWKILVATQNIDNLGPIWTFSLRSVLTFVARGLDINGCVWSYFEGTANLYGYASCTLNTLHCSKVSFLQLSSHENKKNIYTNVKGELTSVRYCR